MSFVHLLTATSTYSGPSDRDLFGDPVAGAQSTFRSRVVQKVRIIRGADGTERTSTHDVATDSLVPQVGGRVWIPGKNTADESDSLEIIGLADADRPDASLRLRILLAG